MLQDRRIIQSHGTHQVLAERQLIQLRDGGSLFLHLVCKGGVEDTFLRATLVDEAHWYVVDLRAIHKDLAVDIPALPRRDTAGVVLLTLRLAFPGLAALRAKVLSNYAANWSDLYAGQAYREAA